MKKIGLFLFAAVLLVASSFTSAQAETVVCTVIDSLPYTISTQGVYCLTGHLNTAMTSSAAITITTNNVVLDLNGFKIGGLSAGTGTLAYGIYANQRQNLTIKNGTVRGFRVGIYLADGSPYTTSQGHLIEDIRADQNTYYGLYISGKGNTVRNNLVIANGGATTSANPSSYGIAIYGPGAQVLDNTVTDVTAQGTGIGAGITTVESNNSVVAGNRVSNIMRGTVLGYGINVTASTGTILKDNSLSTMDYGIYLKSNSNATIVRDNSLTNISFGIWFDGAASGIYMNNLSWSFGTKYTGGTPAGTTNY